MKYKQKLKLLGIASPLALLMCYQLGIAKTIDQYHAYRQNTASEMQYKASAAEGRKLQAKQKALNDIISAYELDTLSASRNLLTIVTQLCNDHELQLREYKPVKTSAGGGVHVLTRSLTVEGGFINCLRLVYALEKKYQAGRVCSVSYTKQGCTLFIQNIIEKI